MEANSNSTRLTSGDLRTLLLWLLAGIIGAGVGYRYFFAAFPEAALDLKVPRVEAEEAAREFVRVQVAPWAADHPLDDYYRSIVFRVEDSSEEGGPKTYLERELGLEEANRLMAGDVVTWFWDVRYFRPSQQEEFRVRVSPAGRIVGYSHTIEEAREGARLELERARATAEKFLRERVGVALDSYDYLPEEANSTERPKRLDWRFSWQRRGFKAKDAPYRLQVTIQGAAVDGYREFLKVPEHWTRDYKRLRSVNTLYQIVAQIPWMLFVGAVVLTLFELSKRGLAPWRGAITLALVLAGLYFLMEANNWPITRASYDTNADYAGFLLQRLSLAALLSVTLGALTGFSAAAGEPLYRSAFPEKLRLGALFSRATWRDALGAKEVFRSCWIGLAMAAAHLGFVVAFYLLGRGIGFWSPQEVKYTDTVSTLIPWIYPLAISVFAATSEEFLFRLFAIPLLLRATGSKFIAIVLPAFVWGFLHSAYPQQPGWVRGVEVGIIGVVAGWVMLRWGILATLVWHYTVDALLIGLFLLRSEGLYFRVSGAVVVALSLFPLLASGGRFLLRRRFADDAALLNAAAPLTPRAQAAAEAPQAETPRGYAALAPAQIRFVAVVGVMAVLALLTPRPVALGDFVRYSTTPAAATARARQVLRQRNVDPARYRSAVVLVNNFLPHGNEYLRRELGLPAANDLYRDQVPAAFWSVRFFRDSEKEEYRVVLLPDGRLHSVHHLLGEKTPGATLTKEEALARAEAWLRDEKKLDLALWKLVESRSEKQPARTDHVFTWEELRPLASRLPVDKGAAHVRFELRVLGQEVAGYRIFVHLTEEWSRAHTASTLASIAYSVGRIVLLTGLAVWAIVLFFLHLREQKVPWMRVSLWASWGPLALLVISINRWPALLALYDSEIALGMFQVTLVIGLFFGVLLAYGAVFLVLALGWFFLARAFGEEALPGWRGMPPAYYRDATVLGAAGAAVLLLLLGRLPALVDRWFPTAQRSLGVVFPDSLDALLPAGSAVAGSVFSALFLAGLIGLIAGFVACLGRRPDGSLRRWIPPLAFVLMCFFLVGEWGSPADLVKNAALAAFTVGAMWLAVTRAVRFNLLGLFLAVASLSLVSDALVLLRQQTLWYQWNGWATVAALVALYLWPVVLGKSGSGARNPDASEDALLT